MKKLTLSILAILFVFSLSLVSCGGEEETKDDTNTEQNTKVEDENAEGDATVADYSAGKDVYVKTCQVCHQENGEGNEAFPTLKDKACNINTVVNGVDGTAMVSFKDQLTNQEISDVANYINHTWGNNFADVTVDDVAASAK